MPISENVSALVHATTPTSADAQFLDALASMLQGAFSQMGQQIGQQLTTALAR